MKAKRLLAVLLSIVMTLSVLPAAAFAADRSAAAEEPMRVFHLDCGRKYFTAEQIKSLIDEMAQDGYNYMELAVGNDGLRFLLDDLSLDYSVETAVAEEALPDDLLTTLDPEVVPPEEIETPQPEETETPKPEEPEAPKPEPETPVEKVDPPVTEEVPPATEQKPPVTEAETPVTEEDSSSAEAETTAEEGILTGELTLAAREENVMSSITHSVKRSFSHEVVEAAIKAGNEAYTTASSGELTKGEMDGIIAYAKKNGISIIPLVNSPGHMDAILTAAQTLTGASGLAYKGSKTTIDVTNAEAVAFTKALLQKYIDYFADKGCQYFNMGADEYDGSATGFQGLQRYGMYDDFITYMNTVAAMIKGAGMTPMAFNDGFYYNDVKDQGTIDSDFIVSYWDGGGSNCSAADLQKDGFRILNTNSNWYYVLGRDNSSWAGLHTAQNGVKNTKWNAGINDPVGAMICIWCDQPGAAYGPAQETNVKGLIRDFAASNADIFAPSLPETGFPFQLGGEPVSDRGFSVGLDKNATLTLTGEGTVSDASASSDFIETSVSSDGRSVTVTPVSAGTGILTVEVTPATRAAGAALYEIPVEAAAADTTPKTVTIDLAVGDTKVETIKGTSYSTVTGEYNKTVVGVTVGGKTQSESAATTIKSGNSYYIKSGSQYLNVDGRFVADAGSAAKWTWDGEHLKNGSRYLRYDKDGWTTTKEETGATLLYVKDSTFYRTRTWFIVDIYSNPLGSAVDLDNGAYTNVTFQGLTAGRTSVQVGHVTYDVRVTAKALPSIKIEYFCTNMRLSDTDGTIKTDEPRTLDFSGVRGFLVTNVCIVQRSAA